MKIERRRIHFFQRRFLCRRRPRILMSLIRTRRQRERQKAIGFMSKITFLHVHHTF